MLGEALIDPHGVDGNAPGLGLLPLVTVFAADKTVRHTRSRFAPTMHGAWSALAGVEVAGYEIHHGQTQAHAAMQAAGDIAAAVLPDGLAWQNVRGNVLGLYLHGLLEDPAALQALFGSRLNGAVPTLDTVFDGLADFIEQHFEPGVLQALLQ
jgi:adenosylcobyric acid synthase